MRRIEIFLVYLEIIEKLIIEIKSYNTRKEEQTLLPAFIAKKSLYYRTCLLNKILPPAKYTFCLMRLLAFSCCLRKLKKVQEPFTLHEYI